MSLSCHCNDHNSAGEKFKVAIIATSIIFFAEVIGGLWSNSLALLSDAAHVFMDVFSLGLSWVALTVAKFPPSDKRTFGYHRIEIFAALINGISLLIISGIIFHEAWKRFLSPEPISSIEMLVFASVGLIVNVAVVIYLKNTDKNDLNLQSALYHVIGDALASVGVIAGGLIIYFSNLYVVDSIISFVIGFIIIFGSVRIIKKSIHILFEGVPEEINLENMLKSLKKIDGVMDVHGVHLWSICSQLYSMSAHVFIKDQSISNGNKILNDINRLLSDEYSITNTTIQFECEVCDNNSLYKKLNH